MQRLFVLTTFFIAPQEQWQARDNAKKTSAAGHEIYKLSQSALFLNLQTHISTASHYDIDLEHHSRSTRALASIRLRSPTSTNTITTTFDRLDHRTPPKMTLLTTLFLIPLLALLISALAIPPPPSLWYWQRATNYKAIHAASMLRYCEEYKEAKSCKDGIKLATVDIKKRTAEKKKDKFKGKTAPEDVLGVKSNTVPGMQCVVM
jgi:hypothetical protein